MTKNRPESPLPTFKRIQTTLVCFLFLTSVLEFLFENSFLPFNFVFPSVRSGFPIQVTQIIESRGGKTPVSTGTTASGWRVAGLLGQPPH